MSWTNTWGRVRTQGEGGSARSVYLVGAEGRIGFDVKEVLPVGRPFSRSDAMEGFILRRRGYVREWRQIACGTLATGGRVP